jgi:DNA ligase 1
MGVDNSRMRLAVDGVYGEYEAMANVWIEHKGTRVSVGSGFTAEQRLKYGVNPDLIVSPHWRMTPTCMC